MHFLEKLKHRKLYLMETRRQDDGYQVKNAIDILQTRHQQPLTRVQWFADKVYNWLVSYTYVRN